MKFRPIIDLTDPAHAKTRLQLLEAAGEVFAEVGFQVATVREICGRAGANVAAVNYHFGDKETLYAQVIYYAHQKAYEKYPPFLNVPPEAPAEKRLHAYIHSLLLRIFEKDGSAWHGRVMLREMIEPTAAFQALIDERMRPMAAALSQVVAGIMKCSVDEPRVRLCALSVVSQCVFYHHCRPIINHLYPDQQIQNARDIARLADHITEFSLAAMRNMPANKTE